MNLTKDGEKSTKQIALENNDIERMYGFKDDKTNYLVSLGKDKLETSIALRLLKQHENEVINNCPKCGRLTRTPFTKQCRYCHHDWH